MSDNMRRGRRRRIEPARIQYGAWDDPRVSLFATVPQEPLGDMLKRMKPLPPGSQSRAMEADACPLTMAMSNDTNRVYREVKYQVQQIADDRNRNYHPIQERERQCAAIARMVAEQNRQEFAEAMRRQQLHTNSQRLRDLRTEIDRAKTTLSVLSKRTENLNMRGSERKEERREALEHREEVRLEKLAEQQALRRKADTYSTQLVAQIHKLQAERAQQHLKDLEEGRQKRHNDEMAHINDLQQAIDLRNKRRIESKQLLDEFAELQRNFKNANPAKPDKLDVIIMEAVSPVTSMFIKKELQGRLDLVERRHRVSDLLAQNLSEIRSKKDARDNLLADILICERQAREKKRAHKEIQMRKNQKLQVAKDLINQRKEKQFYSEKDEALAKNIPRDATCFMQRQYQQADDKEASRHANNVKAYDDIAAGIVNNAERRAALIEEDRQIRQALHDMEADMERRVDAERMRVLHAQPKEIIDELRPCKLNKVERRTFNLPTCGINDEDTPSH